MGRVVAYIPLARFPILEAKKTYVLRLSQNACKFPTRRHRGLAPAARSNSILLRFGISPDELVIHGHTPHFVMLG